ncbi:MULTISPECIES: 50S ribosomal protein L10 [unclassified Actinobaculum]|uniref:50S ribosomal protein L10 n=1 Tax=unclassified Actinobaculum TaxID=2609299 RepID=UPI000D528FC8|nr:MULTISPECIES: 50S ribosomal protein L10 [unclassified Actinobaculum]AWE41985.1 50S ribosomal protein L10 [Actinobaculum sp. 313]RTE50102.1 50S ribosomal protein L10 [Actinobaculum sp. 352]
MARTDKSAAIAELKEKFESSSAVLLTEYRGLTVAQLQELRRSLRANAEYKVAKNTLAMIAANQAGIEDLDDLLTGPTAIAFVTGEVVDAAKAVRDFAQENQQLVIKGGVLEGSLLSADDVVKLADLESREVLLAKAAGVLKAALYQAAYVFQAPAVKAVRTIDALRAKQESAA